MITGATVTSGRSVMSQMRTEVVSGTIPCQQHAVMCDLRGQHPKQWRSFLFALLYQKEVIVKSCAHQPIVFRAPKMTIDYAYEEKLSSFGSWVAAGLTQSAKGEAGEALLSFIVCSLL